MPVVHSPPPPEHLIEGRISRVSVPSLEPRLGRSDKVHHVDTRLEMAVGGYILVMGGRSHIVGEADSVVIIPEIHIQKALICAVEGDASFGHGHEGVVVAQVGRQDHDAGVEEIRPANVGSSRKGGGDIEELVGCSIGENVGVYIDDFGELGLLPEIDLGEGRVQVGAVHEVQVRRVLVAYSGHGNDMIVHGLPG